MTSQELTVIVVGVVIPIAIMVWMLYRIQFTIDDRAVRVRLGTFTLRKIAIADIEFADTASPCWNEHWCNTFWVKGRVVRIRRKSGMFRNFIITPADRQSFLAELRSRTG